MFFYLSTLCANFLTAVKFSWKGQKLTEAIWQDPLTKLVNGFAVSKYGLPDKRRNFGKFIVIFADVNKFKQINDTRGHQYGDQILIQIAEKLKDVFGRREDAIIQRQGGDEFVIILPSSTVSFAEAAMRKVNRDLEVTLSFGVEECTSIDDFVLAKTLADKKMYQMKHQINQTARP